MRFTAEKAPFLSMAERVIKCVERKDTVPILSMFKIEANEGKITISGTNLDTAARGIVAAEVSEPGSCCVPAELLARSVKQSRGTEVSFASDDKAASVSCGRARFKLNILPAEDFPDAGMLEKGGPHQFAAPDGLIGRVSSEVAPVAGTNDAFPHLSGVFMAENDGKLDFVSTDGKMLSKLAVDWPEHLGHDLPNVIIPPKVLTIAEDGSTVVVSDFFIRFDTDGFSVASKLIDGQFPNYRNIIGMMTRNDLNVIVDREELASAIDRVTPFAEGAKDRAMALRVSDGEMKVEGMSANGEASDIVAVDGDASFEIGMSRTVLGPIINSFAGETVRLSIADHKTPMVVTDPMDDSRYALAFPYALRQPIAETQVEAA